MWKLERLLARTKCLPAEGIADKAAAVKGLENPRALSGLQANGISNLREQTANALRRVGGVFFSAAARVRQAPAPAATAARPADAWLRANGDRTLRLNYDLDEGSLAFDLGGYQGQWASDIFAMYGCRVFVFELAPAFAEAIRLRFARNPRISSYPFGLGSRGGVVRATLAGDRSSVFGMSAETFEGRIVRAADFLQKNGIARVDLMKVNIEGGEYDLLEHLLDTGLMTRFRDVQVQFHDCVPDAFERMKSIQSRLRVTHELTYSYTFVWENWRLKARQ